jgi:hypothetical protein
VPDLSAKPSPTATALAAVAARLLDELATFEGRKE